MRIRAAFTSIATLLLAPLLVQYAWAQAYPSRPIRMITPWPPGGGTDVIASSARRWHRTCQAGRRRLLAVTSASRSTALPDMPTAVEAGLPGFVLTEWYGILAPARTAASHIDRIREEVRKALSHAETKQRLLALGAEMAASTPKVFAAYIRSERSEWAKVIKAAGIKAE